MRYGTGEADPDGVTDRDKAWYANEAGQAGPDLLRPFYELDAAGSDADALAELVATEWDHAAGGRAGGGIGGPPALPALPAP